MYHPKSMTVNKFGQHVLQQKHADLEEQLEELQLQYSTQIETRYGYVIERLSFLDFLIKSTRDAIVTYSILPTLKYDVIIPGAKEFVKFSGSYFAVKKNGEIQKTVPFPIKVGDVLEFTSNQFQNTLSKCLVSFLLKYEIKNN